MKPVMSHKSFVTRLCAIGCALLVAQVVGAQAFPSKNLQMIVPYTPGGSADLFSRVMAQKLGEAWGRTVVVDNRPGASGMIGTELVTKAEPDGHVLLGHTSSYPATASVRAKLPFDPARAIVPVAMIARAPMLIAVHPSVPAKNVKELIAVAKTHAGRAQLRIVRHGRQQPLLRRAVRRGRGHQDDPRSLQGHLAGGHGAGVRRNRGR